MLDIPVFHDDQHGTAIVVVGALRNALRVVGKDLADCKIVVCGAGAAGSAIIRLLLQKGPGDILAVDVNGIVHPDRGDLDPNLTWLAENTNRDLVTGSADRRAGRRGRVHRRVRAEPVRRRRGRHDGRRTRSCSRWPTRTRRSTRWRRRSTPRWWRPGRSDYPNQINNVLAFPGVFRGLLDAQARGITDAMLLAAADAIADVVDGDRLNASFIVPSVFDSAVAPAVAEAVARRAAHAVASGS